MTALHGGGAPGGHKREAFIVQPDALPALIVELIGSEFGVSYHRDHVGRLMHSVGWSHQKPETRAAERDEEAIDRWKRKDRPRAKKTLRGWAPAMAPHLAATSRPGCTEFPAGQCRFKLTFTSSGAPLFGASAPHRELGFKMRFEGRTPEAGVCSES